MLVEYLPGKLVDVNAQCVDKCNGVPDSACMWRSIHKGMVWTA